MRRSDMTAAAKFRVTCHRCQATSPLYTWSYLARWAAQHEQEHHALDRMADIPVTPYEAALDRGPLDWGPAAD